MQSCDDQKSGKISWKDLQAVFPARKHVTEAKRRGRLRVGGSAPQVSSVSITPSALPSAPSTSGVSSHYSVWTNTDVILHIENEHWSSLQRAIPIKMVGNKVVDPIPQLDFLQA